MALDKRITSVAEDPKEGLTIDELLEFAQEVESALERGQIFRDDILRASIGFSAQVKRITVEPQEKDKGVFHTA